MAGLTTLKIMSRQGEMLMYIEEGSQMESSTWYFPVIPTKN